MQNKQLSTYDFTEDPSLQTPFWKDFWKNKINGSTPCDPDVESKQLQYCHKLAWGNRKLPCGKIFNLKEGDNCELIWEDENMRFSSDWLINTYIHWKRCYPVLKEIYDKNPSCYRNYMENFIRTTYTIGGSIIFPKRLNGINQTRGCIDLISDRFDLTLECIRRYYDGNQESPLKEVLNQDKKFFNLFVDFKGYVDFFYLKDLVSEDYKSVKIFFGHSDFKNVAYPRTSQEWNIWAQKAQEFIQKRNARIDNESRK